MMREKLQKIQVKRLVILNLPYFFIFYVADKGSWLYRHCLGESMVQRLGVMLVNFRLAFLSWLPSIALQDLTVGVLVASALKLVVYYRSKNAKKFRQGVEYGSARWGNRKDIEPFMDPVFENNVILTETERLTMNSRPKAPKYARNKNVIVIGGSGSGKTRFYVKPNLMQMTDHVSYVVTDPKGTIIVECGKMLVNGGYRIKVLNTINFKKSMHYNPFHYIRSEKDILKLVNTIIANTKGEGEKSTEDFWVKAERLLYSALIGYIWYEAPEEEQNFSTLLEFINASETREDDEEFKNAVDAVFNDNPPADYKAHSMSVSDVIITNRGGDMQAYYVDRFGFAELPDFAVQREKILDIVPEIENVDYENDLTCISFYAAECAEFPVMGEVHYDLTLPEALEAYEKIPSERMHGLKCVGFDLKDGSDYEGMQSLMIEGKIQKEFLNSIPGFRENSYVQNAISRVEKYLEERHPNVENPLESNKKVDNEKNISKEKNEKELNIQMKPIPKKKRGEMSL